MAAVSDELITVLKIDNLSGYSSALGTAGDLMELFGAKVDKTAGKQLAWGAAGLAAGGAIAAGLYQAVKAAGEGERLGVAFQTIDGNAAAAAAEVQDLGSSLAGQRFGDEEVVRMALGLRRMGASAKDAKDIIDSMAGAVAANAGSTQDLAQITEVLALAEERHQFTSRELRTLIRAGIPVYDILQQKLHLTADQMQNLDLHGQQADAALRALIQGSKEKFGGALERDLSTIDGASQAAAVSLHNVQEEIGGAIGGQFVALAKGVKGLADWFVKLPPAAKQATALGIEVLGGALTILGTIVLVNTFRTAKRTAQAIIELADAHAKAATAAGRHALAEGEVATALEAEKLAGGGAGAGGKAAGKAAGGSGFLGKATFAGEIIAGTVASADAADQASGAIHKTTGIPKWLTDAGAYGANLPAGIYHNATQLPGMIDKIRSYSAFDLGKLHLPGGTVQNPFFDRGSMERTMAEEAAAGKGAKSGQSDKPKDTQQMILDELKRANDLKEQQLQALKDLPKNLPVSTDQVAGAQQVAAAMGAWIA